MKNTKFVHADTESVRSHETVLSQSMMFEVALNSVLQQGLQCDEESSELERKQFLTQLALKCHDLGIAEENAVMFTQLRYGQWRDEAGLTLHNLYTQTNRSFGALVTMNPEQRKSFLIDDFLRRNYALRYNVMTRQTEFGSLTRHNYSFSPLTQRERYEMRERMAKEGIQLWDSDLKQRLESKSVRDFYPMEDFLERLPKWDGRPRIEKLAMTVPTDMEEWPERFRRWFIAMVASWYRPDRRYGNSLIPVLVGAQGCGKSQWIRSLLPEEMQAYYHDGFCMKRQEEAEAMMTRYALINIDEFDAIPLRHEPVLKHLIQLSEVHDNGQPSRRFCSFIATSNHYGLHRDTSGSRRYIFVDVKGQINLNHRLSLLQIYAEALNAVKCGERTYFTKSEERALQTANEGFREQDVSEQLFLNHFEPLPFRGHADGEQWLTAIEIYKEIERMSKKDLGLRRANRFGSILTKHCGQSGKKAGNASMMYHVRHRASEAAPNPTLN